MTHTHTQTNKQTQTWVKFILFHFSLLTIALFTSCQKDLLLEADINADNYSKSGGITVIDGRLYFPSKESLGEIFTQFADAPESEIFEYMQGFYNDGFFSLRPPAYEENEDAIISQYENRVAAFFDKYGSIMEEERVYDRIDDTQYVIGSDAFATFLNENGEIHVGNKIYKYTDVGLFFVDEDNFDELVAFLSERNIADNLIIETTQAAINSFSNEVIGRGYSEFEGGNISLFVSPCGPIDPTITNPSFMPPDSEFPIDQPCDGWYVGGGGSSNPNPVSPLDGLQNFVDNLSLCSASNGFLGSLFGTNRICIDKYESRRRVRTKVFNHNYLLVYHTGIKVKHQYKGWTGIWRQQNTDVVAAGVEMVQFEYDYSSLITSNFQNLNSNVNYSVKPINFTYNVGTNVWVNQSGTQPYTLFSTYTWLPNLPTVFHDDLIIEAFNLDYTLLTSNQLNDHFWGSVWNSAKNQLKSLTNNPNWENPKNITLLANYPNLGKVHIQRSYFNYCTNCSKREKTFAFDGAFTLSIGYNDTSGKFTYTGGQGNLVPPKKFKIKMYGAAKRNGQWHGSKLYHGVD